MAKVIWMTHKEFEEHLERLDWTQRRAAEQLDVTERQVRRWANGKDAQGEHRIPKTVAFYLRSATRPLITRPRRAREADRPVTR
jgi:hypothetical protein